MTLAEIEVFSSDLNLFLGKNLVDFYAAHGYQNHNGFSTDSVFPLAILPFFKMYPRLMSVGRWGRHILLRFDTCTVVFKMSAGTGFVAGRDNAELSIDREHIAACASFLNSSDHKAKEYLFFTDSMRCGSVNVYPANVVPSEFSYLGLDIMDSAFTYKYLSSAMLERATVKWQNPTVVSFLMDRKVVAWLDGLVLSEALFTASINPCQRITELGDVQVRILSKALPITCRRLIDVWRTTGNASSTGGYSVYARDGQTCISCKKKIRKDAVSGVVVYWCPTCQTMRASTKNGVS